MLKFKIFLVSLLLFLVCFCYEWLYAFNQSQIPLIYTSPLLPFIKIKNPEVSIYEDDESFSPEANYRIYCLEHCNQYYRLSKDNQKQICEVFAENHKGISYKSFKINYKPPKIKEVIKEVKVPIAVPNLNTNHNATQNLSDEPYLNGAHDLEVAKDTDMHTFVSLLSTGISSNCQIGIDYSEVNLSYPGTYKVIYYYGIKELQINVTVK